MLSLPPVLSLRAQVATARGRCHCTRKVSLREEGVIAGPDPQSSAFRLPGCRIGVRHDKKGGLSLQVFACHCARKLSLRAPTRNPVPSDSLDAGSSPA